MSPVPVPVGGFRQIAVLRLSSLGDVILTLPAVHALARAFPDTRIVLNHAGGPIGTGAYSGKRNEVFPRWAASIKALALHQNVFIKVGGLGQSINGLGFDKQTEPPSAEMLATSWRRYVETCIEAFGPERAMFESNFPVDKGSCSYQALWNAFKRISAGASPADKHALFNGTASRVYRLGAT